MNFALAHNVSAWIKGVLGAAQAAQTAGSEAEVTGVTIDRYALANRCRSAALIVAGRATLTSGKTLAITANFQDSANDSDWTDYGETTEVLTAEQVLDAAGGALAATAFSVELPINLVTARRYIRAQFTPVFSFTGTDTGEFAAVVILGGAEVMPQ